MKEEKIWKRKRIRVKGATAHQEVFLIQRWVNVVDSSENELDFGEKKVQNRVKE